MCLEVIGRRSSVLLKELTALRSKPHEDSIHDTRVASRRMRAAMEAYRDLLPAREWRLLYKKLRQITRTLGGARETEVNLGLLNGLKNGGDMAENLCLEYLIERLKKRLAKQQRQMNRNIAALDPEKLKQALGTLLQSPNQTGQAAGRQAQGLRWNRKYLKQILKSKRVSTYQPTLFEMQDHGASRSFRVISELADPLLAMTQARAIRRGPEEGLHRLRIAAKKLRYAMEIFDAVWPGGLKQEIGLLRDVQTAGGDFHDWCVLEERIRSEKARLSEADTPHLGFQLGRLLGEVEERKAKLRSKICPPAAELHAALRRLLPGGSQDATPARRPRKRSEAGRKTGMESL